jgi:hypothetical protein
VPINLIIAIVPSAFSLLAAIIGLMAHRKASQAAEYAKLANPYNNLPAAAAAKIAGMYGAGPFDNAGPNDVANLIGGVDGGTGQALSFRLAAMLYDAHMFGLAKDYAFPEGSNVSASMTDQVTTLTKLLTRKKKMPDGNDYDLWDAVFTAAKGELVANPHLNDDEVNSVNYKKTS